MHRTNGNMRGEFMQNNSLSLLATLCLSTAMFVLPAMAQKHTYGHQGFTGTVFWCDPDEDLIYVFLSNRVYPDAEPNKLSKSRLRLLVHEVIYQDLAD